MPLLLLLLLGLSDSDRRRQGDGQTHGPAAEHAAPGTKDAQNSQIFPTDIASQPGFSSAPRQAPPLG